MLASVASHGLNGIAGFPVTVEADLSGGLPAYDTVGLPDAAVRESRERGPRRHQKRRGFSFPTAHITVSLAPAGMRKEGGRVRFAHRRCAARGFRTGAPRMPPMGLWCWVSWRWMGRCAPFPACCQWR